jgi:hypothetical protein
MYGLHHVKKKFSNENSKILKHDFIILYYIHSKFIKHYKSFFFSTTINSTYLYSKLFYFFILWVGLPFGRNGAPGKNRIPSVFLYNRLYSLYMHINYNYIGMLFKLSFH